MTNPARFLLLSILALAVAGCSGGDRVPAPFVPGSLDYVEKGTLLQVSSYDTTGGNNDRINIHAGETATIFRRSGPGVISRIWITIDSRDPHFLRRILLRMYWDGEDEPSVEVPVGDFFGSGFEYRHHISQMTGMSSGGYYSFFPMPFQEEARIEVVNQTGREIYAFYYQVDYYRLEAPLPDRTPTFHAAWRRDIRTEADSNFLALEAEGAGYYVGTHFHGQSYSGGLGYLEGDEMFYVDGEENPSIQGTGLEDYFTSGWYFQQGEYDAPWHGLVMKDDSAGRIAAYRHHIRDAIPFRKSLRATFEHGHNNEDAVDFSTTAFWYQTEPHRPFAPLKPAGLRIPLRRPVPNGAVEAETLGAKSEADAGVADMTAHGADWSGGRQLQVEGREGTSFELVVPGLIEESYHVEIYPTGGPDYGNWSVSSAAGSGTRGGDAVSFKGFREQVTPAEKVVLNRVRPRGDSLRLRFTMTGKNVSSDGYRAGIDALNLIPVREYIPKWQLIGPFPNPRESDDLRFGLDSVYAPEKEIDLDAAYRGVDGQRVRWQKYTGGEGGYAMNLNGRYSPDEFIISYALTWIHSPVRQSVPLMLGTDDGAKVFLNGEQLYRFLEVRVAAPDQDTVRLPLRKGWNKLLLKLENNFGGYAFYARIIDRSDNLTVSADQPQQ